MLVTDNQLDIFVGKGSAFEAILHSLIRAEAWACSLPQDQIDWDYRTNVGDGGRDVFIRVGNSNSIRKFIPSTPSVWSAKSGRDGLKPATLRKEILDHPKVLEHLRGGGSYVWCVVAPADNDEIRDNLRVEALSLAGEHGFENNQIVFFFRDNIASWLNQHPGLASVYLKLPRGWKTLEEWRRRDKNFSVPWVGFGDRAELIQRIEEHLLGSSGLNVIHLAGWSGIGKTRTALQACLDDAGLEGVLYFPGYDSFTAEAEDYLARNEGIRAAVVIDEVELGDWNELRARMEHYANRIRVVTVGTGAREDVTAREGVINIPTPESAGGVSQVIQSSDPSLTAEQTARLAEWCDHDLRLALLLVEANKQDPGLTEQAISSVEDVWRRILNLFRSEIGDVNRFRDLYEVLSVSVDVGNIGEPRQELEYLAKYFGKPEADFDRVIAQAISCGLGRQQGRYFEAGSRALVRRVFERAGWPRLKPAASKFIGGMPTLRLQKRFVERGHECNVEAREDVAAALTAWFHEQFPSYDIGLLAERQASKVFEAYAELNPNLGLAWLQRAVEKASPEELLTFDANTDESGFWRGRRQVVWLCDHLAQFPEYFWQCEAILFRLGLRETELRTVNNSRGVWQRFFRPVFSWTATPYEERINHLVKRIKKADTDQQPMIMGAALEAIKEPTGETVPPSVVGGRLAPPEWRPEDKDFRGVRAAAARSLIDAIKELPVDQIEIPRTSVIENIGLFLSLGCLEHLQGWLLPSSLDEDTLRQLRINVDSYLSLLRVRAEGSDWLSIHPTEEQKAQAKKALSKVEAWRSTLEPEGLDERIRELTGRENWQHKDGTAIEDWERQAAAAYESLASEVIRTPEVMDGLRDWFDSDKARSAFQFGQALGRMDESYTLLERMFSNLVEDRAINLLVGYFDGIIKKIGYVPEPLSRLLDSEGEKHPLFVIHITLQCDISDAGFERLLRLTPLVEPNASSKFENLSYRGWAEILTDEQKARVIQSLAMLGAAGDVWAYKVALDLVTYWGYQKWKELPDSIAGTIAPILESCLGGKHHFDAWDWSRTVKKLPPSHNLKKIDLLTRAIVGKEIYLEVRDDALHLLSELARELPDEVMKALGERALDPETMPYFYVGEFHGLFETIGLDVVSRWIKEEAGVTGARAIARHVFGPSPTPDNPAYVPPLTEWLLSESKMTSKYSMNFALAGTRARPLWDQ